MAKVYHTTHIKDNYTYDELKRSKFMEIKSARFSEKGFGNEDMLVLGLQKYPLKGKAHLTVDYGFIGDTAHKFMKEGIGVISADELIGKVIMGIVNKDKPVLDGLCAYN